MSIPDKHPYPPEVRTVYEGLRDEVCTLYTIWDSYEQLYGTEERIAVLNKTASGAFGLIQGLFRNEFIMGICRLTDPEKTGKFENLTIDHLMSVIHDKTKDSEFDKELKEKRDGIDKLIVPFRTHRNKTLGHLDRETALNYRPGLLPGVNRDAVQSVMMQIEHFMQTVQSHYTFIHFDFIRHMTGPAHNIMQCLEGFHRLGKLEYQWQNEQLLREAEERKKT